MQNRTSEKRSNRKNNNRGLSNKNRKSNWFLYLRLTVIILAIVIFIAFKYTKVSLNVDNYYTHTISLNLMRGLTKVSNLVPFSLSEIFVGIVVLYFIFATFYIFYRVLTKEYKRAANNLFSMVSLACLLFLMFFVLFGFNYKQVGLRYIFNIPKTEISKEDLLKYTKKLVLKTNLDRENLVKGQSFNNGVDYASKPLGEIKITKPIIDEINNAFVKVSSKHIMLNQFYSIPKPVKLSRWMSRAGIAGIFIPYFGEANYNNDVIDIYKIGLMIHEMGHQRGLAYEDECNLLPFIISNNTDNYIIKYSSDLLLISYMLNEVYRVDGDKYKEIQNELSLGVKFDLENNRNYWKQFEGKIMEYGEKVNDNYLKFNGTSGTITYSKVVSLFIDYEKHYNTIK